MRFTYRTLRAARNRDGFTPLVKGGQGGFAVVKLLQRLILSVLVAACSVGPNYTRPTMDVPAAYKEAGEWKVAQPADDANRGKWWEIFSDAELSRLEEQVEVSNQNVRAADAQYRNSQALADAARAGYFPIVSASGSASRSSARSGGSSSTATSSSTGGSSGPSNQFSASLSASWEVDVWGKVRRTVEASEANVQASAADLASLRLSMQATLAQDYFQLRIADAQQRLLEATVAGYERSLTLVTNQYNAGVVAKSDVAQATTQLKSAQAQLIDVGVQRAQFDHAIAVLIGKAPADFSIAAKALDVVVPAIPRELPSALLERRPDIAAAERRAAAANAQIGVAEAAYFPSLTLSASGGFAGSSLGHLFSLPNRFWSIGAALAETVFDAGRRRAETRGAIASFDAAVANYRQTVLAGFQEVEDNLVALRLSLNQYRAGIVTYLQVVTAQNTELTNERAALDLLRRRMVAAATLVKALGGGWKAP